MKPLERKLLRDIGRRRGQFAAVVMTALLGTALFAASFDAWRNLQASYDHVFVELALADFTLVGVAEGARGEVVGVAGAREVEERLVGETAVRSGGQRVAARLVGYSSEREPALNRIRLVSGTLAQGEEVVVEEHLAEALSVSPGDRLDIALADGWRAVRVSGVAVSSEYLWPARSRQEIFVPPGEWGVLFGPPALVTALPPSASTRQLLVGYDDLAERLAVDERLRELASGLGATDAFSRAEQPSNAALQEDIDAFGELSLLFPVLFLGAAGMAVYILLGRLVRAQRAEIGVLLALGMPRRRVLSHYLGFGILAGLAGAVPGAAIGVVLGSVVTTLYTDTLGIPTRVLRLYPETPLIALGFGLVAGLLAAAAPALTAARVSPGEAMRGSGVAVGGTSLAERALPSLRRLPIRWKLVLRGIGRSRVRSVTTLIGVIAAVTLVLTSWGLLDTVQILAARQFDQIERQSLEVTAAEPVDAELLARVRSVDGVAAAEPVARVRVGLVSSAGRYGTPLVGFVPGTEMHEFLAPGGSPRELPPDGLLLGDALRRQLDVEPGDRLTVITEAGRPVEARVAGFVREPLGTHAYASLPYLRDLLGAEAVAAQMRSLLVRLADEPAAPRVEASLGRLEGVTAITASDALRELVDDYMGLFYAFVGVMFVLGGLLAFAVIFTTISANVSERIVELATLRASGASDGEIGRMITAENLLLTAIGVVPGLALGYLGAAEFMAAFSSDLLAFDLQVRPTTFVIAAVAAFAAAALSLVPALRAVRGVDLGQVVRERAT